MFSDYSSVEQFPEDTVFTVDLEGTVVEYEAEGTAEQYLLERLGVPAEMEEELRQEHSDGFGIVDHLEYGEELRKLVANHQDRRGMEEQDFKQGRNELLHSRVRIPDSSWEVMTQLSENGLAVALTSEPYSVAAPVAEELGFDGIYRWRGFKFDGGWFQDIYVNDEAAGGKQQVVGDARDQGLDVCHLGDGAGDEEAALEADLGVLRSGNEELEDFHRRAVEEVESFGD